MVDVPIDILTRWRMEDRDIHRLLAVRGPMRTPQISDTTRYTRGATRDALLRLENLGVVQSRRLSSQMRDGVLWAAACVASKSTLTSFGRVIQKKAATTWQH